MTLLGFINSKNFIDIIDFISFKNFTDNFFLTLFGIINSKHFIDIINLIDFLYPYENNPSYYQSYQFYSLLISL